MHWFYSRVMLKRQWKRDISGISLRATWHWTFDVFHPSCHTAPFVVITLHTATRKASISTLALLSSV